MNSQSINVHSSVGIEECQELIVPILLSTSLEPVREDGNSWPDNALVQRVIAVLQERVDALVEGSIVLIRLVRNGGVDHNDVVLIIAVERIDELTHKFKRKACRIKREDPALVHVINCNIVSSCLCDYIRYGCRSLSVHMVSRGIFACE